MLPHEIARLEEARLALALEEIGIEHLRVGGGVAAYGGTPASWMNLVVGVGMNGAVDDDALDAIVAFYEARGVAPEVEVCPFADLSFARGMAARGYALDHFETVLARGLEDAPPARFADGVTLERVDPGDEAQLAEFLAAHVACFSPEGGARAEAMAEGARRMAAHDEVTPWIVRVDGEVAGSGAVEIRQRIATLLAVGILEPFRRRGIQQALIAHRCALARDAGCEIATIGSAPESATGRNALRLGFVTAYTKAILKPGRSR